MGTVGVGTSHDSTRIEKNSRVWEAEEAGPAATFALRATAVKEAEHHVGERCDATRCGAAIGLRRTMRRPTVNVTRLVASAVNVSKELENVYGHVEGESR